MFKRRLLQAALPLLLLSLGGFGAWLLSLPSAPAGLAGPPVAASETAALLASLAPTRRQRPLIAVVGINDATETTDYLVPTGILRRADVADVVTLASGPGPVRLFPALTVEADATLAAFDARNPAGADYVIVPAMSRDDDPAVLAWLRGQARKGAIIIGVCAGAKVVAAAGLLDGKRATTHWYYLKELLSRHPSIRYVADRRVVADHGVVTTTGITASMPMALLLIEAIAGRRKARAVAQDLAIPAWDIRHASGAFALTRPFATTVLGNVLAFWNREQVGIELRPGMDEVSLALAADAWSRTYRSQAVSYAQASGAIATRNRIRVIPDAAAADWPATRRIDTYTDQAPAQTLDRTLHAIAGRYGAPTASVVAMQLEYPWRGASAATTALAARSIHPEGLQPTQKTTSSCSNRAPSSCISPSAMAACDTYQAALRPTRRSTPTERPQSAFLRDRPFFSEPPNCVLPELPSP
ncbi:probable transcriptional regulator [Bordetella bronchiseptica MO149]|uniref:DJ-1/PfpI family protein n=1 Tax=Bordetella bronchiseptica TaxID=518 RepID=UPI00028B34F7|nr:DJ-1/PfpI family protein [Bordetella bronchiseptica]CCJ59518.1 probable transcriptional regulator [Bordetella bronchiseptica MO149]